MAQTDGSDAPRVLILEDSPEDAELMVQHLLDEGRQVHWQRVDTREDYLAALHTPIDIILADYSLPQFGAVEALSLLRETDLDIPLIVVSGTIGEEIAVQTLTAGASDYLLKDRLARLGQAMDRAMTAARLRRDKREADLALQESLECFHGFVRRSTEGIVLTDEQGIVVVWNEAQAEIVGIPSESAIGRPAWELQCQVALPARRSPEYCRRIGESFQEALASGSAPWSGVLSAYEIERPDGNRRFVESVAFLFPSARGHRAGSVTRDITRRTRDEQITAALYGISRAANEQDEPEALFRAIHASVAQLMPAGSFYIALHDSRTGSFTFPYFSDQVHPAPATRGSTGAKTEYVMRTGRPLLAAADTLQALQEQGELELTGIQPFSYLGVPLTTDRGPIGVVAVQSYDSEVRYTEQDRDILAFVSTQIAAAIQRQTAREEIVQTRDFYGNLIDEFPTPVWRTTALGVHDYFSKSWLAFTGRNLSEELGDGWLEGVHPDDAQARCQAFAQAMATGEPFQMEYRLRHRTGGYRWVLDIGHPFATTGGSFAGYIGTCYDITERRLAEEALRESERKLRGLIDYSKDGISLEDEHGRVVEWNPAMERITGVPRERILGRPLWDEPRIAALLEDGRPQYRMTAHGEPGRQGAAADPDRARDIQYVAEAPQKARKTVRVLSFPVPTGLGVMTGSIARDVTDELATAQRLALGERLESVGRLAGGIAHDFNNLLTALVAHADFARAQLAPGDPSREDLDQVLTAADRAASLTRQLLAFSRRQPMEQRVVSLNDLFLGLERMLRRLIREDIVLLTSLSPGLYLTRVDPGQIEQAITNLVINARDAMPAGGALTIETANASLDEEYVRQHPDASVGDYAALTVTDTGCGMTEDLMDHILEPFFTTKDANKGTGLGLPTVFGIVRQHQGHLWYHSELGRGSTFRIYLPRCTDDAEPKATGRTHAEALPTGHETILVVEDEPSVRQVTCRMLSALGYCVLSAANGEDALRLAQEDERAIDLLVTDLVMPHMGGRQLASRFQALRPGVALLYVSGHTDDDADGTRLPEAGERFLPKPFTPTTLALAVRAALDDGAARA